MPVLPADAAAFIFDCDGTLVDSMDAWLSVWPDVAAEFGVPAVAADFDAYEHLSVEQECIEIHRDFGLRGSAEAFEARIRQEMAERYRTRVRALSGVRAFLGQAAAAGIPMAVATSTSADLVVPCLEQNGIAAYFGAVVTTGMVGASKAEPIVYDRARELVAPGVSRRDCWVFEDALFGLSTARRAGYHVVGIADPHRPDGAGRARALSEVFIESYAELSLSEVR